uniref:PDZ domain-containing protein n=1 Tax=Angiostrongylus cantonensis TaxID=6313 RepID=A0A158P5V2_ANGCA
MMDSFKIPRKLLDTGTQKSFSVENMNQASSKVGVLLKTEDSAGFGMSIQGNMNEGIYVKNVVPKGVADLTGNILPGDRIKSLTIDFDYMVYEDAVTLLSYASPYKVKFELERKIETSPSTDRHISSPRLHPLFRSNTLTHIHFNPIWQSHYSSENLNECSDSSNTIESSVMVDDLNSTVLEKEVEQKTEEEKEILSAVDNAESPIVISETIDNAPIDLSKVESSDYASDNTSEYRESESESANEGQPQLNTTKPCSFTNINDHLEVTNSLETEKSIAVTNPAQPKIEYCNMLPPKQKPFATLDADRQQRIAANQDVLDRQTEELRKLGIL